MSKFFSTCLLVLMTTTFVFAQKTDYKKAAVRVDIPASYPATFKDFKTFDFTFFDEREVFSRKEKVNFSPNFGNIKQTNDSEELHVITNLYNIKIYKDKNSGTMVFDIDMETFVANKYSSIIYKKYYAWRAASVPTDASKFGCVAYAIDASLGDFTKCVNGYQAQLNVPLGFLDNVKKKSELANFEQQVEQLKKDLEKSGIAAFLKTAEPYLPFWEKMTQYSEKGEVNEVKRAAYQNLVAYYILSKNIDKAKTYLEEYKKVDKDIKEMFGLIKYKNSDESAKLLSALYPEPIKVDELAGGDKVLNKATIVDKVKYLIVEGTVKIKDKKRGGTYKGIIKVKNIMTQPKSSGMMNLDAEDVDIIIIAPNANGKIDTFNTFISKIEEMQDKEGNFYISQKMSDPTAISIAAPGSYGLMKTTFKSAKIVVYTCIIPTDNNGDFYICKTTDNKGIKTGMFNNFKKVTEYMSDCPSFANKVKSGEINKNTTLEKMAELYTECK